MEFFILVAVIILFAIFFIWLFTPNKENQVQADNRPRYEVAPLSHITYLMGHPDLDNPGICDIAIKIPNLHLLDSTGTTVATIPTKNIRGINLADRSTIEHHANITKVALFGVLGLLAKDQIKRSLFYMIIDWNDGQFDHQTFFSFSGFYASKHANLARNTLIRTLRETN